MNDSLLFALALEMGNPSEAIEAREHEWADSMDQGALWYIPLQETQYDQFVSLGFTINQKNWRGLIEVKPPDGWTIRRDGRDPRRRIMVDAKGVVRASIWLKVNTGSVSLLTDEERKQRAQDAKVRAKSELDGW